LSSSTVGDAGGSVVQSNAGQFVDLTADNAGPPVSVATAAATTDTVSGGLTFTTTNANGSTTVYTTTATSVSGLIAEINAKHIPGVTASFSTAAAAGDQTDFAGDTGIQLTNTNPNVAISLATLDDTNTSITPGALTADNSATTTTSYKFAAAGDTSANLKGTDLTDALNAQAALSAINLAVSYVAAQDGYIGAQINTLNSISQVVSTQQENVVSAQNALQATDYASTTSNMSKYEILSQTGISALAQANSVEQEVTKLLQ